MIWCLGSHTLKLNFCQCVEGWSSSHARLLPLFYNDNITPQDTRICSFRKTHYVKTGFNEHHFNEHHGLGSPDPEGGTSAVFMGTAVELGQMNLLCVPSWSVMTVYSWSPHGASRSWSTHTTHTTLEIPYRPLSPTSQADSLFLSWFTQIYEFCSYSVTSSILNNALVSSPGLFCLCRVPVCMFDITERLLVLHLWFCLSSCIRCCLSEFSFGKTLQPTLSLGPHNPALHTDLTGILNLYTLTWTNSLFSSLFLDLHFCFVPNPWKIPLIYFYVN